MKKNNFLLNFIKSPYSIIIYLIVVVFILLIINYNITRSTNVYVFNGFNEDFTFMDGSIYIGHDINNFTSPNIIYSGKEILLKEYVIGYYIENNDEFNVISVKENDSDEENLVKLSELIKITEFSFTEYHKNAKFFSKKTIDNIEKLCFVITGIDDTGEEISLKIKLDVVKIS